ncbi:YcgL domain-containing protein [Neptunicella marina]|uniref:YcgL domain-containing protein H8B19_15235 n=1 Tax=Neptunicella marina TaxID=2125989 RepID=A0A8J6IXY6_9ALTE|nr:YcgL domain-containing protein [Neptunicella marina]MBC3767233.1 YcgL domain-containing protein [Neptunicella marina]
MLCAVYKSSKKAETYLFVNKRDDFSDVPDSLLQTFGKPLFVMMLLLKPSRKMAISDPHAVKLALEQQGFYLQLPPPTENLLEQHRIKNQGNNPL